MNSADKNRFDRPETHGRADALPAARLLIILALVALAVACHRTTYSDAQLGQAKNVVFNAEISLSNGRSVSLGKAITFFVEDQKLTGKSTEASACEREGLGKGICVFAFWEGEKNGPGFVGWMVLPDGRVLPLNENSRAFGSPAFDASAAKKIFQ